ncbi:MAG: autotransporter outer membrane beta-barrel domain-containing protein, partial [Arenimonas sp.]
VGGLGAVTTGDGILLVDVGGSSSANAFSLNNNLEIGAFNYYLYQNGLNNPADGDWYLRSAARGITSPAMAIPDMGNKAGLSILGTMQERLGGAGNDKEDGGAWIRVVGNAGSQTHQSNIGDFNARNDSNLVQVGIDLNSSDNIRWGVFAAKTQSTSHMFDLNVDPDVEVGAAKVDGYAFGAYATHYGETFYWDAVVQHAWLDATASGGGDRFETDSKNWLASFEFGGAFKFGNGIALEPQAQVIIGKGSTDDAADSIATYDYNNEDITLARLGVRWSQTKDGSGFAPFLKLNVWRNFGDDSQVSIGPSAITTERNDTWMELGAGFSVSTGNNWSIFMQYDYEKGMGQSDLENHTGTLGLRRSW